MLHYILCFKGYINSMQDVIAEWIPRQSSDKNAAFTALQTSVIRNHLLKSSLRNSIAKPDTASPTSQAFSIACNCIPPVSIHQPVQFVRAFSRNLQPHKWNIDTGYQEQSCYAFSRFSIEQCGPIKVLDANSCKTGRPLSLMELMILE